MGHFLRLCMRTQAGLMEPLLRRAGLPAFLSRETVHLTCAHLHHSAAKAQREPGWSHPAAAEMWDRIVERGRERMAGRRSFLDKRAHRPVWA